MSLGPSKNLHKIQDDNKTIVELRTKLEIRTWFLRASLAVNTGVIAALVFKVLSG